MPDREKVLQGLEWCIRKMEGQLVCDECPYDEDFNCLGCSVVLRQAIALLKKPKRESRAMLPCKCGCKRREHWIAPGAEMPEILKCYQCGFTVRGKNQTDVIRQWNKAVSGNG